MCSSRQAGWIVVVMSCSLYRWAVEDVNGVCSGLSRLLRWDFGYCRGLGVRTSECVVMHLFGGSMRTSTES